MKKKSETGVNFWGAVSIGIGGMVGGGIFAVLGLAVLLAQGGTPIAFLIAGSVALLTSYSYAKLSVCYPSEGGTVIFIDKAFGVDFFTGSINSLLWISYVVTIALYAYAFGSYAATFFPGENVFWTKHLLISAAIIIPTLLNMLSAELISKAETYIVLIKVTILVFFIAVGFSGVQAARLEPVTWAPSTQLIAGGMIIFVAYEGFELIANTAKDVRNYKVTLPRAFYASVIFVIFLYILIAIVAVGTLTPSQLAHAQDFALAEAAKPSLGQFGFTLIAIAAMLSTLSAINATLYGSARLSYVVAMEGELPKLLEKKVWGKNYLEGLLSTAAFALILANVGNLSNISTMGSAGFLLIFAAVNAANWVKSKEANSNRVISTFGVLLCLFALGALVWQTFRDEPSDLWILAGMFGLALLIEGAYILFLKESSRQGRIS
jgi:amino acid transporter